MHSQLNNIRRKGNSENPCSGVLFFFFFPWNVQEKTIQGILKLSLWGCWSHSTLCHNWTRQRLPTAFISKQFVILQIKPALISCGTVDLPSCPNDLIITFQNLWLLDRSLFVSAWIIHLLLYITYRQNFLVS